MNTTNYKQKDYETIFLEMLNDGYLEGLLSTDEHFIDYVKNRDDIENSFIMNMSIYALKDSHQYEDMTNIYLSNDVDVAVGVDLDVLGHKCATYRPQATKSSVELYFSLDNILDYDYVIPQNTVVSNNEGISYLTVEDATIIRGEYSTTVGALSVMNGGNSRVEPNTLIYSTLPNNVSVTNPKGSSGSREAYTDNEYRELLRNWTYAHIRGTKEAYEEFFANYDGLDDYRLVPRWDGPGTLKIIIDPFNDWLKTDLYNKLQEKTFLLIESVLITGAVRRPLDIDCTINVDIDNVVDYSAVDYTNLRSLVERALSVYVDGGYRRDGTYHKGLKIGQDFIPFKAGIFINEEIPQIMSIDWKDTLNKIDNTVNFDEFLPYEEEGSVANATIDYSNGLITASQNQKCRTDILYSNYPYLVESDNKGFIITFKKMDSETGNVLELFSTSQAKFKTENLDLYGGWIELVAKRDNASISYIRLYENDSDNDNYNTHICINNEEKAYLRNVVVKIQGEDNPTC